MQSLRHAYTFSVHGTHPAVFRRRTPDTKLVPGNYTRNRSSAARVSNFRRLICACVKSQDTQPGISRQTLKQALQAAAQTERGYLTKLLIVSAIGAAGVKFGSLLINTPFQPSGITALSIIILPCLMYSALLLTRQGE